jgi:FtsZ-binding cell division protein ZapB
MLQGYGDTVLRAEALEEQLVKARKHSAMLQSKLDGAFAQYHNEVQDMQAKRDELVRKNKSLRNKNKGKKLSCRVPIGDVLQWSDPPCLLIAELETHVEQLRASEVDMKNLFYREKEARRYLNMTIRSWLTSATSTWSFVLRQTVTSSTAINLCRS